MTAVFELSTESPRLARQRPLCRASVWKGVLALWLFCVPGLPGMVSSVGAQGIVTANIPPHPMREFRGTWIATVGNTDWPSKPGLTTVQQKAELLEILDKAVQLRLNAVILQVRPTGDAFYKSSHEPWSEYLTGQMGKAPQPYYDPLAFAIEQAHLRGLELHAWFNPFRARNVAAKSPLAANHISQARPDLIRRYNNLLCLDPGEPAAREHVTKVILEVVKNYDVDAIHLDDYFYPYKVKDPRTQKWLDFPDDPSWNKYLAAGGKLSRNDWRRKNIDDFIENLYVKIKAEKPWVKFGISPFGIWRPGNPQQITGMDAYDTIFADARKWLASGWLDYCAPQLYWPIGSKGQSYPILLDWWSSQNARNRHLWIGNNSYEVGVNWKRDEILNQLRITRQRPGASGNIHWNVSSLTKNKGGLADALARQIYTEPALVPASPWLGNQAPAKPNIRLEQATPNGHVIVKWEPGREEKVWLWVCQTRTRQRWTTEIFPGTQNSRLLLEKKHERPEVIAITGLDRFGNTGPTALLEIGDAGKQTVSLK